MTPGAYNMARKYLGMSNSDVAKWLGVTTRTCEKWAVKGPSGPASVAIRMRMSLEALLRDGDRYSLIDGWAGQCLQPHKHGSWIKCADVEMVVLPLPAPPK